jgi:hypothetical protein
VHTSEFMYCSWKQTLGAILTGLIAVGQDRLNRALGGVNAVMMSIRFVCLSIALVEVLTS